MVKFQQEQVATFIGIHSDHQFANNIKEEIIKRLEPLWDINNVKVTFNDEKIESSTIN